MTSQIRIFGARQHNLKNLDVSFDTGKITVLTGVSGSGKSSLAFDTLYAEGQRRYVETFSPYARQFLDRMDKPQVDKIEGILPAIAIDQVNPVRNSRSSVGTMTELNDYFKLLYARLSHLHCRQCGHEVHHEDAQRIATLLAERCSTHDPRLVISFAVDVPANFTTEEVQQFLEQQGYTRTHPTPPQHTKGKAATQRLYVIQDRFRLSRAEPARLMEALDTALHYGNGHLTVFAIGADHTEEQWEFSAGLHCAHCDIDYASPQPSTFSFNSPYGACETCKGFGRVMGIDYGLVIPDENKSLLEGAIKPWQTESNRVHQQDLERYAKAVQIRLAAPWNTLSQEEKDWVIYGAPDFKGGTRAWKQQWYGVQRYFDWQESRAYKMHVRVMLSKYRSYNTCPSCAGSRLKPDALLWRLGQQTAPQDPAPYTRFMPVNTAWSSTQLDALPGFHIHDLMRLPISSVLSWFQALQFQGDLNAATQLLRDEITTRLRFLCEVGLGYLSLDRQSRTLSGGEVQRINLTTALGTSLVNTLFVLDEPSIGLHPHDMQRIVRIMQRLRHRGNTLVVVEHDPQVMVAADRILDIGPGPGERGGTILFDGPPSQLREAATLTGDYLSSRKTIEAPHPQPVLDNTPRLLLQGVQAHNLKNIDVSFPLERLVCVTGVSGSGKSTLIQDVLYPALLKHFGEATEAPGPFDALLGAERIAEVVMVDQSPIGRTARSNPASYVGAFDAIRKLFARAPLAVERGYKPGTFSFNSGDGRCPTCGGTGFEHIEMQFLSDVYLRCPDCEGKRFRPEILEVRLEHLGRTASIDEVLEMTVNEALLFFTGLNDVQRALAPLADVGLDYLSLGQPVPTLSGGEAQRLKLAGYLAEASKSRLASARVAKKGKLFLFDEPTTGLHFDDIAKLMHAFRKLLQAGHSLIVIEHNLDVIRAADWIIDLGPLGGEAGGHLVATGSPQQIQATPESLTGQALIQYEQQIIGKNLIPALAEASASYAADAPIDSSIHILNAREHNLKNIQVSIPRDTFTVITGVSGSGKSTLAFDILFNEGQRRYLESLNAYARSIVQPAGQPDVDAVYGIPPTVAIEQRTSRGGYKSTVATMTEIHHFLRLLYVKLGTQMCPCCHVPVEPQTAEQIMAQLLRNHMGQTIALYAPLIVARKGYYTDLAKWAHSKGYAHLRVDGELVATDNWPRLDRYKEHTIDLPIAELTVSANAEEDLRQAVHSALEHGQQRMVLVSGMHSQTVSTLRACPSCDTSYPEPDPRLFSYNSKHGWCPSCFGTGRIVPDFDAEQSGEESKWLHDHDDTAAEPITCPSCAGQRLNPVALAFRWKDQGIAQLSALPILEAKHFFSQVNLSEREQHVARDIFSEIQSRLSFMEEVGLGYLALDRAAPTLSGGEAQRIRLAAQLGSNLQGVCYVLDEPTIGLHPRDNRILLQALQRLEANGNTLVVVEHDEDTIRQAQHIIDMGPGAGIRGGEVVAQGDLAAIMANPNSLTGHYLRQPIAHPMLGYRPIETDTTFLTIEQAHLHNIQNVSARIPLNRLTAVTGVSGSGKSTLARDILLANLKDHLTDPNNHVWQHCKTITGWEHVDRVLEVDQTPIGKTPRSCPATYVGFWDDIRKLFAQTRDAKMRGWTPTRFSFNTGDGRCAECGGQGLVTFEMSFLPDIQIPCESCHGLRFNNDTLSVSWQGKNIGEVLRMEVDEAVEYFASHPRILRPLQLLQDVGLGYLTLGQPSPTLSGGEAQRIKLVTELSKVRLDEGLTKTGRAYKQPHTLYVLDEPTVGLAIADVEKLLRVLHRLTDAQQSVVVIEHNLDLIAEADWIIDMGPEGGIDGGQLVVEGTVNTVQNTPSSHTGQALVDFLSRS
ncbi:excinuclease ABC subunit A [Paenalcaligenes hominis]|uniref:UvrABC system protein A n=1 Tax=Paenalcaligenes hominis TaxID=643674 RepID=A0ABX0WTY5_9BURK|nr:excinuclease ABC subunit UvrA [Paenalcaligenes hominis]NJB66226.1 excinuclease ABC subunit A [Paenalcaligenes hominis]GGE74223.1 UvrABC system protein A [Paenalcaligenes hominis]